MKRVLIIVDCQNDFIDGTLGTPEAVNIVNNVVGKISSESWDNIYTTMDTHTYDYFGSMEGRKLPVEHCILHTEGWNLNEKILDALKDREYTEVRKFTFGSVTLPNYLLEDLEHIDMFKNVECTIIGLCTNICVISNAMLLKAHFPEMRIIVDASCCAGTTPERHRMALEMMKDCHIDVINEE